MDFSSETLEHHPLTEASPLYVRFVSADGDETEFRPGARRQQVLTELRRAVSAELHFPRVEHVLAEASSVGEPALRAWAMALTAAELGLTGPVDIAPTPNQRSARSNAPSSSELSAENCRIIAEQTVTAVQSVQAAAATCSGADALAVESFLGEAVQDAAFAYSRGGTVRQRLCDVLTFSGADFDFPWPLIRGAAESLAILYNFAPFQDTGSTVASKRLRAFAESFDVISCSFLQHKKQDPTVDAISRPYVCSKELLPLSPSWATWGPFRAFATRAARSASARINNGARYRRLYTRAMWAPSLYAGIQVKLDHPELFWTAEFSDPLSLDVEGSQRGGPIARDDFSIPLIERLESDFGPLSEADLTILRFAELLVYGYADGIVFTNAHQKMIMIETIEQPELRERVERISTVAHHPTLSSGYYEIETTDYSVDDNHIHLGYFGEFYTARGITEITDALRALPEHIRDRVRLHIFTNYIPEAAGGTKPASFSRKQFDLLVNRTLEGVGATDLDENIVFNNSLPFLQFLAVSQALDYLIVTDASSGAGHPINPYLPSKWSDYKGSTAKVWALVEEGSVLSSMDLDVRSPIGDAHAARSVLWSLVADRFGDEADLAEPKPESESVEEDQA
ncbi:hypothetical protein [Brevibacterium sediminis]